MQAHGGKLCLRPAGLASFAFVYVFKIHNTQSYTHTASKHSDIYWTICSYLGEKN